MYIIYKSDRVEVKYMVVELFIVLYSVTPCMGIIGFNSDENIMIVESRYDVLLL